MGEHESSQGASSEAASLDSSSSSSRESSLSHVLSAVAVSLATVASIVVLSLRHALDDVPGWVKLLAISTAGMAASEKAAILGSAARGLISRKGK